AFKHDPEAYEKVMASFDHGKRCERPTVLTCFPLALFRRALRFGLEQSFGTKSATFVGFGSEQHQPAGSPGRSDGTAFLAG
ncbi:MAG TPA: hypothetical protein PLR76_15010, partial [Hyphomonas sp.]|nr:hypothetical protein [Hyphomonas sp.]